MSVRTSNSLFWEVPPSWCPEMRTWELARQDPFWDLAVIHILQSRSSSGEKGACLPRLSVPVTLVLIFKTNNSMIWLTRTKSNVN